MSNQTTCSIAAPLNKYLIKGTTLCQSFSQYLQSPSGNWQLTISNGGISLQQPNTKKNGFTLYKGADVAYLSITANDGNFQATDSTGKVIWPNPSPDNGNVVWPNPLTDFSNVGIVSLEDTADGNCILKIFNIDYSLKTSYTPTSN